ncbi:MAG: Hsp20/alpha crystallin family protein [Parcubacteria group bacterium]|nr:Hsp20/alpha crystallin family protein [Parcubacteria group bacterium]
MSRLKNKEKFVFPISNDAPIWEMSSKKDEDSPKTFLEEGVEEEGELNIDVYQNEKAIIIKTAIAGVNKKDLEISLNHDMLTIRGNRKPDTEIKPEDYFYQECYWGKFSRSMILPTNVNAAKTKAELKNGVLTVTLPKLTDNSGIIKVKEII